MSLHLLYFSPTGTVCNTVRLISKELNKNSNNELKIKIHDFTLPSNRFTIPKNKSKDIVVVGMPVYAGRIPNLMLPYINKIKGNGAKVIPIVVYGNRSYGDSLSELFNILSNNGFSVIAAGAFVARHSFSDKVGGGRPNEKDLLQINEFSDLINKLLKGELLGNTFNTTSIVNSLNSLNKPSEQLEYYKPLDINGEFIDIRNVKPLTKENCNNCGICARECPMGAISHNNKDVVGKCIKCCRCVRICPLSSKYFNDKGFLYHVKDLENTLTGIEANNQFFI